ncbi:cysteine desulfurase/sulfurtransferase TusA family protein [Actinacidiphila bryophytorum]|uniref:Cysteine desulfurase n=1 Tax=Actinacidiphila bryophytorum TaxID=1436133 RepID=A0A9W4GZC7_9ACTN|nr:cysteine desulfurase/sulfurtransferase TusA family protein [Actinacidiphila bryophytorum]MBM9436323.1 aminotransferase class V-fold PLP-dependent enzyme [Actinacidiphila bryophytorum]MBN6547387.1 aminotransferase class V-fold PLP-dependent enzyme [Actinacidiphila bryophytorum]CAG7631760.1 Cysteine desulfurase [Actinacidiphila bryophytorum]
MPYFDMASAAPLHPVAREALLAALDEGWADPSRLYREGRRARLLLDAARQTAAEAVGCRPDELVFTPSGTRALHDGLTGAMAGRRRTGRHVVVSAVEHSAVLHAAGAYEAASVGVDRAGRVAPADVAAALRPDTALVCLQSANHEVGTVQPVAEVAELCRTAGVPLLVDAAQSLAWGPVEGGWSLLAGSAHKWGGPPGVGLLAVRKGTRFAPQHPADERESGRSPGFENLPAIVAAAASLRAVRSEAAAEAARLSALVDRIRVRVPELVPDVEVVGHGTLRLPHLVTFSCLYVDGEALLTAFDRAGFSVSSGSSCTSSTLTPSHVLKAMGVLSEGNVRVSLPPGTSGEDVDRFLDVLPGLVSDVRSHLGATPAPALDADLVVDSLGKLCPIPVIELAKVIDQVPVGGVVTVLSDDEAAGLDIPAWCSMRGHTYLGSARAPQGTAYHIRRTP